MNRNKNYGTKKITDNDIITMSVVFTGWDHEQSKKNKWDQEHLNKSNSNSKALKWKYLLHTNSKTSCLEHKKGLFLTQSNRWVKILDECKL